MERAYATPLTGYKLMFPSLSLPDIANVLDIGKQLKTAQKFVGKLREAGLVSV